MSLEETFTLETADSSPAVGPAAPVTAASADGHVGPYAIRQRLSARLRALPLPSLLYGSAALFFASSAVNVGNYAFNVLAGRSLGPEPYGALTAIVSLLNVVSIPAIALQTMTAREVARGAAGGRTIMRRAHRLSIGLAVVIVVVFAVLAAPLNHLMAVGSPFPIPIMGVAAAMLVMASVLRGALQGRTAFGALSISMLADPVIRISTLVVLLLAGLRLGAGLLAYAASGVCVYAVARALVARESGRLPDSTVPGARVSPEAEVRARSILPYAVVVGLTASLYSIDVVAARAGLPQHDAGLYAAGAVLGKAIFFVGGAATIVMLPMVAQRAERGEPHRQLLLQALAFTGVLSAAALFVYLLVPRFVIRVAYGSEFADLGGNLGLIGIAMFLFTAANVGTNYLVALGRWRILAPLACVALAQVALLAAMHGTIRQIALDQIAIMLALNVVIWPLVARGGKDASRAA